MFIGIYRFLTFAFVSHYDPGDPACDLVGRTRDSPQS